MVFGKKKIVKQIKSKKVVKVVKVDSFLNYLLKFKKRTKVTIDEIIKKYNELK
jgi:hypothetical protein